MRCLLCNLQFIKENLLKKHYGNFHAVNEEDVHFKELFKSDTIGSSNLLLNIIKRGSITYYLGLFLQMKCLLCNLQFIKEKVLKKRYVDYHAVNEEDVHFKELFKPDTTERKCKICHVTFDNAKMKKKHMFLFHYGTYQQIGRGPRSSDLPLNIIKIDPITYYSISFDQHKNFYDFFSSDVVDTFLNSVYQVFRSNKESKFQGYAEIVNQQRDEIVLEDKRV